MRAMEPISGVQFGVKSFGCENRIAHFSPIHSWKRIVPSVVSAEKSGASSPIRIDMCDLRCVAAPAGGNRELYGRPGYRIKAPYGWRRGLRFAPRPA